MVLKVHKILMLNQRGLTPDQKGYFRKIPVWIGGREGLGWRSIQRAMENWIGDVETSLNIPGKDGKHIKIDHIEYEKIHPFVDGNGRTGRMFYNWQRLKCGLPLHIIHEGEEQMEYYQWFK